nr:hypothetical protein [Aneurinibacillus sp. XH2]
MKLTDEQIQLLEDEFCNGCEVYNGDVHVSYEAFKLVSRLLADRQAWKKEAENYKQLFEGEMDLRHQWMDEAYENKDKLSQAVEVLEWIRDAGTDYQSIKKAASFLASLSQETEQ